MVMGASLGAIRCELDEFGVYDVGHVEFAGRTRLAHCAGPAHTDLGCLGVKRSDGTQSPLIPRRTHSKSSIGVLANAAESRNSAPASHNRGRSDSAISCDPEYRTPRPNDVEGRSRGSTYGTFGSRGAKADGLASNRSEKAAKTVSSSGTSAP